MQVQHEHRQQTAAQNPQNCTFWCEWVQKFFEKFGVAVKFGSPEIHLQIADHVKQNKTHQGDSGDGHGIFFADCSRIKVK